MNEDNEDLTNAGPISALQEAACDDGVVCRSVQWQGTGPGTPCLDQNEDSDICLNTRMNHSLSPAQNSILFGNMLTPNPELISFHPQLVHYLAGRKTMRIPFTINDDIIISSNDKGNDVCNGCLINSARELHPHNFLAPPPAQRVRLLIPAP